MKPEFHPNVKAAIERLNPVGDFVLVKRAPELPRLVIAPQWRNPRPEVKRGLVVAIGPGDQVAELCCVECGSRKDVLVEQATPDGSCAMRKGAGRCECGGAYELAGVGRAEMHVEPGDLILYQRAPANNCVVDGEEYVLLHESLHILAVIEAEAVDMAAAA
jgi:co-chaperonin GroES (HSP10)